MTPPDRIRRRRTPAPRRARLALVVLAFAAAGAAPAGPAPAAAGARTPPAVETARPGLSGSFRLSIGGLLVGRAALATETRGGRYRITLDGEAAGLVARFRSGRVEAVTEGALKAGAPVPGAFRIAFIGTRTPREVSVLYGPAGPEVTAEPGFDPRPWQIAPSGQADALDPLSALLAAFAPGPRAGLCDRVFAVFDGRRRYGVRLDPAEARSDLGTVGCAVEIRRSAGFKPKMRAKPPIRLRATFEPWRDGLWRLRRLVGKTALGAAVLARDCPRRGCREGRR